MSLNAQISASGTYLLASGGRKRMRNGGIKYML
jgi:hypothetical protein